jgi:hypothetical protein
MEKWRHGDMDMEIFFFLLNIFIRFWIKEQSYGTFIHIIHSTIFCSFIHTASSKASVNCYYKTSNDNRIYRDNVSGIYGKGSIPLDGALSAVEKTEQMVLARTVEVMQMMQRMAA